MTQINYAAEALDVRQARVARIFARIAFLCAVVPMAVGVGITVVYRFIDSEFLVDAGLLALPTGTLVILLGLAFAIIWTIQRRSVARKLGQETSSGPPIALILFLLSNFGVALACAAVGERLTRRVEICVYNKSGSSIDDCGIEMPLVRPVEKPFADSKSIEGSYRVWDGDKIHLHLQQGGKAEAIDYHVPPVPSETGGAIEINLGKGLGVAFEPQWRQGF
jgi:hypothetical protein